MKHTVMFVDDRPSEIQAMWNAAPFAPFKKGEHRLLAPEVFESIEKTLEQAKNLDPTVIIVGHGLGQQSVTGTDVIRALRKAGYTGWIFGNSGAKGSPFQEEGLLHEIDEPNIGRDPANLTVLNWKYNEPRALSVALLKARLHQGDLQNFVAELPVIAKGVQKAEECVVACLHQDTVPVTALDAAIDHFILIARNHSEPDDHGNWIHSASHFTERLLKNRAYESAKKIYGMACGKIMEFHTQKHWKTKAAFNCLERLVGDFVWQAPWDTLPATYGFNQDFLLVHLHWWEKGPLDELALFPFVSEEACASWRKKEREARARAHEEWLAARKDPFNLHQ